MSGGPAPADGSQPVALPARVGVLGTGAMGAAMAIGLARAVPAPDLVLVDAVPQAAAAAAAASGGRVGTIDDLAGVGLLVLAVKPKDAQDALARASTTLPAGAVVASVVAGLTLDRLAAMAPGHPVVRLMPNLAVRHGDGLVVLAARPEDAAQADSLVTALAVLGTVVPLGEQLFAAATALAGSGPGLVALIAEALEEGGVGCGLSRAEARAMTAGVLAGTAALLADGTDPATLRQMVTSPAGTTAAGVAVLERGAVRASVADAVRAAADRAREL